MYLENSLFNDIIYAIVHQGVQVTLVWIPGQIGIRGNALADRAAKVTLELPICTTNVPSIVLKISIEEVCSRKKCRP